MRRKEGPRRGSGNAVLLCAAALLGAPSAALAQEAEKSPLADPALRELQQQNNELEQRVERLEQALQNKGGDGGADPVDASLGDDEDFGLIFRYGKAVVSFQLFGDVGFEWDNPPLGAPTGRGGNSSFALGTVDLTVNAQVGEHFRLLSETVLNTATTGQTTVVQMRLWGMWEFSDALYMKLGTEHSPLSRWNQLFHHGRYLEISVRRPLLARFEAAGGILPVHATGLEAGGRVHPGLGMVEYWGAISNGRGPTVADRNTSGDPNDEKRFDLGAAITPSFLPDLRVGGSFTYDEIPPLAGTTNPDRMQNAREMIGAVNAEALLANFDIFGEFAWIGHEYRGTGTKYGSHSGYLQVAYEIGDWTPYTRFDYRNMAEGDPFYQGESPAVFNRDLDVWQQILGIRHELAQNVAFKAEVGLGEAQTRATPGGPINEDTTVAIAFQLAWSL